MTADFDPVRVTSRALYGNRYRLEIAAAIYENEGEAFSAMRISEQTGVLHQRVQEMLKAWALEGVITRVTEDRGVEVFYKTLPSAFWENAYRHLRELKGEQEGS